MTGMGFDLPLIQTYGKSGIIKEKLIEFQSLINNK